MSNLTCLQRHLPPASSFWMAAGMLLVGMVVMFAWAAASRTATWKRCAGGACGFAFAFFGLVQFANAVTLVDAVAWGMRRC